MYFFSQPESPKIVYLKINRTIFSCTTNNQIKSCLNLINNFVKMYGDYIDGDNSAKQLYFNLSQHQRSIWIKNEIERISIKKQILQKKTHTVQFLRDPSTHYVFAYFPNYKTKNYQTLRLCYYMGKYCELNLDYIKKCEHPIFPEYRDLLLHLKSQINLLVLTPHIKYN